MDLNELRKMDATSLRSEVHSLKKELFNLRLTTLAGQGKDSSQFKKLRKKIAQCLTLVNQGGVDGVESKKTTTHKKTIKK